jgi:hypothetical protein
MSSIVWLEGEQEKFRSRLFPEEMSYYVDADVVARCRDQPGSMKAMDWQALTSKGGFYINLLVGYGPHDLAVAAVAAQLDHDADTIWPFHGALAVLGEDVIPTAIRTLERAVSHLGQGVYANQIQLALEDIAPVRSARVAELVIEVLASAAKPKVKALAKAWLVRHAAVAGPAVSAATGSADPKRKAAGKAAAKLIAG